MSNDNELSSLEAVYYSAQIPRNAASLTTLGLVFDKLHFPGVYLPKSGFDQRELDKEIERIAELRRTNSHRDDDLVEMLNFIRYAKTLEGFCTFDTDTNEIFGNSTISQDSVSNIYTAIHGPNPEGWHPMFSSAVTKQLPGSEECIAYLGTYHYLASAIITSAQKRLPLINDLPNLPIEGQAAPAKDDAQALASLLALRCATILMPKIPMLQPQELMEFRAENEKGMALFRREMFKMAAQLNKDVGEMTLPDLEHKTEFFIKTNIIPQLEELSDLINSPQRNWGKRAGQILRFSPRMVAAFGTGGKWAALASIVTDLVPSFIAEEVEAAGKKREASRQNGLHYLLQIRDLAR